MSITWFKKQNSLCFLDTGERDSSTDLIGGEENSNKMKTSEEADFEKEFRPDDVGKDYRRIHQKKRLRKRLRQVEMHFPRLIKCLLFWAKYIWTNQQIW